MIRSGTVFITPAEMYSSKRILRHFLRNELHYMLVSRQLRMQ